MTLLKDKRAVFSTVLISAVCLFGAMVGGLLIGVQIASLRVNYCTEIANSGVHDSEETETTPSSFSSSWICPPGIVAQPTAEKTTDTTNTSNAAIAVVPRERGPFSAIKPAMIEIGVFAIVQTLGLRFFKISASVVGRKLPQILSRVTPLAKLSRSVGRLTVAFRRVASKSVGGLYEATKLVYKKTAASKVVTRTKKIVKAYSKKKKYAGIKTEQEQQEEEQSISSH